MSARAALWACKTEQALGLTQWKIRGLSVDKHTFVGMYYTLQPMRGLETISLLQTPDALDSNIFAQWAI